MPKSKPLKFSTLCLESEKLLLDRTHTIVGVERICGYFISSR